MSSRRARALAHAARMEQKAERVHKAAEAFANALEAKRPNGLLVSIRTRDYGSPPEERYKSVVTLLNGQKRETCQGWGATHHEATMDAIERLHDESIPF